MGLPLGVATFALTCGLPAGVAYSAGWSLLYAPDGDWMVTTALVMLAVIVPVPVLMTVRGLTALQRLRFRVLLGVGIPPPPRHGDPRSVCSTQPAHHCARLGAGYRAIIYAAVSLRR